ncbi:MAG TPA: FAD-dependent oxidoreductase [Thermoanaerobaculia bacterium]|nr:FAD-dependent oxidoreductase [Thermoanaerobaculia bacterium]
MAVRLLLVGVGHAHLEILLRLARRPPGGPEIELTVVSPGELHHYSGMVPGFLSGIYREEEIAVRLRDLVLRAGRTTESRLVLGRAVGFEPGSRVVAVESSPPAAPLPTASASHREAGSDDREGESERSKGTAPERLSYDLVSFAVGSDSAGAAAFQGVESIQPIKPIGRAAELRRRIGQLAGSPREEAVVVVGGGAGGVEIALAVAGRFAAAGARHRISLVEAGPRILTGYGDRFVRRAEQALRRRGVAVHASGRVAAVDENQDALRLEDGTLIPSRLTVWVTGAIGWPLFRGCGLPLDRRGFLLVDQALRSLADPRVFAAGDCGTLAAFPETPKAGVYAVREGPVLWRSLRAALAGSEPPPRYRPQRGFLSILNTGDGRALLRWGALVSHGRWAMRFKDRIDRRFLARYQ